MNMQAIMAQAQRMQRDITQKKNEIDNMEFVGKSEWVEATMKGTKELTNIKILSDEAFNKDNAEILSDMISIAVNNASKQIDAELDKKLGAYKNMGGLM